MVEALTDNRARTGGDVRIIFEKAGGNMGLPGCVGYLFERKGLILIDAAKYPDEDAVMTAALEAEADDFQKVDAVYEITTDPTKFSAVLDAITKAGYETIEADVKQLPKAVAEVDVETGKKVMRLIDNLDNNDDVQNVYTTANLTVEMMD
jgi:YebC/PmpR family DNA-binding regulatory protein